MAEQVTSKASVDEGKEERKKPVKEKKEAIVKTAAGDAPKAGDVEEAKPVDAAAAKAVEKSEKKAEKTDKKDVKKKEIVLERVYTIPLLKSYKKSEMQRADYAIRMVRKFLSRHMKSAEVKISVAVNNAIRARGSGRPLKKVKVKAQKERDGKVTAELMQ